MPWYSSRSGQTYEPGSGDVHHMQHFYKWAVWSRVFCWWPRWCCISGKFLWLQRAWLGEATYYGPGDPVVEQLWHDSNEHLIWLLKGKSL